MKCDAGHDMQPIICHANPKASEWYCDKEGCHQSIYMTADEIHQLSGGRLVADAVMSDAQERQGSPAKR